MKNYKQRLKSLTLFRHLLSDKVVSHMHAIFCSEGQNTTKEAESEYCEFVSHLYNEGGDLGLYLLRLVMDSENAVVRMRAASKKESPEMTACLETELELLSQISAISPENVWKNMGEKEYLPKYASTPQDFVSVYQEKLSEIEKCGYGIFAKYHMFTLSDDGECVPVKHPDTQSIEDMTGYERERGMVVLNTRALLKNLVANNMLLYGDAGTGKSSTVKAIANEYAKEGLRLVEIRKNQLYQIPKLMNKLAENSLKFILFIDDLSFPSNDEDFTALKAILEGNISARPKNIVVYATSNRRHMVKEQFSDRQGGDIHLSDTLQEQSSLSARFGLTVTFLKPDKDLYLDIVMGLSEVCGLKTPKDELCAMAEAHALRYGGRSPRTAKQFVEWVKATENL